MKVNQKNNFNKTNINNIYLDFDIGLGGLGGKISSEFDNSINMYDETIKDYISNPEVGGNTILNIQYKTPYKYRYLNLYEEYFIGNINYNNDVNDIYISIIDDNIIDNIEFIIKNKNKNESKNIWFI